MMASYWFIITLCYFVLWNRTWAQNQQVSDQFTYPMDSTSNCGNSFEVGMNKFMVIGHGATQSAAPLDCTMTFTSIKINEERKFAIEVISAAIKDSGVKFYMYDSDRVENAIDSFGLNDAPGQNYRLKYTSGSFVTFQLKRSTVDDFNYDIRIVVTPMTGDINFPDQCAGGKGYNCVPFYHYNPFTKEVIIGIVGGIFGLIIFIVIPLCLFCCYRRSKGVNRRWDEHKLSTPHINTAADLQSSNGSAKGTVDMRSRDNRSKDLWTSQSSRAPFSSVPRGRMARYSEDDDSVFDEPPKKRPPPPPYERYDSRETLDRDGRYERNDRYDRYDKSRNMGSYRKTRGGPKGPELYRNNSETSFVQSKDDHPQETFVERIIEPRVKPKSDVKQRADYVEEDTYDLIDHRKLSEDKPLVADHGIQCENESDSEEPRETDSEEEQTETESDEENDKDMDSKSALYAKPNKQSHPDRPVPAERQTQPDKPVPAERHKNPPDIQNTLPQGAIFHPVPITPGPGMQPMAMAGVPPTQRLPFQGYMLPQGPPHAAVQPQFVPGNYQPMLTRPVQPGPRQYHPVPRGQLPPQSQPQTLQPAVIGSNAPPIYSYLVQRGYTPLDGRHSPVSNSTQASQHSDLRPTHTDESDMNANLDSGVELMKRTTVV